MAAKMISVAEACITAIMSHEDPKMLMAALSLVILAMAAVAAILAHILKRRHDRTMNDPVVSAAYRLSQFYMDRPLPAMLTLHRKNRRGRRQAMSENFPSCSLPELERAVWEAEYNEFVSYELDNEISHIRKAFPKSAKRPIRIAIRMLNETRRYLPHGMSVRFTCPHTFPKDLRYRLPDAHAWLDHARGSGRVDEDFKAIRNSRFRCARCGANWNEDISLHVSMSENGIPIVLCSRCAADT